MGYPRMMLCDTEIDANGKWTTIIVLPNRKMGWSTGDGTKEKSIVCALRYAGDTSSSSNDLTECTLEFRKGYWYATVSTVKGRTETSYSVKKWDAIKYAIKALR